MFAFSKGIGTCSALHAELWGILTGIKLMLQRDISHVEIESDSLSCIRFLTTGCAASHSCASLVSEIRSLLSRFAGITWIHIFREGNGVADLLAKHGLSLDTVLVVFDSLSSFCSVAFLLDNAATVFCRG